MMLWRRSAFPATFIIIQRYVICAIVAGTSFGLQSVQRSPIVYLPFGRGFRLISLSLVSMWGCASALFDGVLIVSNGVSSP
jgi:hypothetical protein